MAQTKVLPCTCESKYQDEKYGKGKRLHNEYIKPTPGGFRCTMCERTKGH